MVTFEKQYEDLIVEIMTNGVSNEGNEVRTVWKDGESAYTKAIWGWQFRLRPGEGFPILTRKYVNPRSFTAEILWIMQKASNVVADARELGTGVWDEWEKEDGTILKAYGYQIKNNTYKVDYEEISEKAKKAIGKTFGKEKTRDYRFYYCQDGHIWVYLNQIDYVIQQLIDNPFSRQTITTLMNPKEHHKMALPPCVWSSHWEVMGDGKLYLSVKARSSDVFLGLPFNISQYALLHRLIAHVVRRPLGDFVFTIDDAHLYDRHLEIGMEYLKRQPKEVPEFWLDQSVESFQDFEYDKTFGWIGYTREKYGTMSAPIAVGRDELDEDVRERIK